MARLIALLRAVNVGGRKVGMAELREACEAGGFKDVTTYIASGNLVVDGRAAGAETRLEALIERRFGFEVPVIVRTAEQWAAYLAKNPLAREAADSPSRLVLLVSKKAADRAAPQALAARAQHGEVVTHCGDALVMYFAAGIGASKLSPALIDRLAGSPTTGRNWNTVRKLAELVGLPR
jgi:uncharacterized protein (DUF1697 family)